MHESVSLITCYVLNGRDGLYIAFGGSQFWRTDSQNREESNGKPCHYLP